MSNIVKPLEWKEITNRVCLWEAKFPGIMLYRYKALKFLSGRTICSLELDAWGETATIWEQENFSTIEEAKAACDKHYEEFVLSLLSPEATGLLLKHDF